SAVVLFTEVTNCHLAHGQVVTTSSDLDNLGAGTSVFRFRKGPQDLRANLFRAISCLQLDKIIDNRVAFLLAQTPDRSQPQLQVALTASYFEENRSRARAAMR